MTESSAAASTYPALPRSCKRRYPFRLGTTSFIYPDHYIPNVRMLGPFVDEIELLMFESRWPDSLPSREIVDALARLSTEMDIGYNVHLPTDVSLASADQAERDIAVSVISKFVAAVTPLEPSACALHLPFHGYRQDAAGVERWKAAASAGIGALIATGVESRLLAVETLDYPFAWVAPLVEAFDLSVCMDIGHLILYGQDPEAFFQRHQKRVPLIHLHGVRFPEGQNAGGGRDHLGLDKMTPAHFPPVMRILNTFDGVVSLEVFSCRHLVSSMRELEERWRDHQKESRI